MKRNMMTSADWQKRREQGKKGKLSKNQSERERRPTKRQIIETQAEHCYDFIKPQEERLKGFHFFVEPLSMRLDAYRATESMIMDRSLIFK